MSEAHDAIRGRVRERYGEIARAPAETCCSNLYTAEELARVPREAVLGQGSGTPVRHAGLRGGEVVVDLGSGAGIDVFLAANRVGPSGRTVGVDMTPAMLERARQAARGHGIGTVEFREGVIESLPLGDALADAVISNCVINLSPDKAAVFREAFRVLKPGGRLVVSDIVKERPFDPTGDSCGCVENAMVRDAYLDTIRSAGFRAVEVVEDRPYVQRGNEVQASAVTIRAWKPKEEGRT